jgi:hypothetical protein
MSNISEEIRDLTANDIGQNLGTLGRHMGHWADIGQTLGRHCSHTYVYHVRLFVFLMQYKTFWFSHGTFRFPYAPLCKIKLSGFLIQDKTFCFSYPR